MKNFVCTYLIVLLLISCTASFKNQLYGDNKKEHTLDSFDLETLSSRQVI